MGPRGFTITTHSKDLRPAGTWRYTMHGPDGVDYPNVTRYLEVEPLRRLVYDHGGTDDRPPLFRVTANFAERRGRTTLDLVFALSSPEAAQTTARFIKQVGGNATWDRLAEHLEDVATGRPCFVVNRSFEAPLARVVEHWSRPERLARGRRPGPPAPLAAPRRRARGGVPLRPRGRRGTRDGALRRGAPRADAGDGDASAARRRGRVLRGRTGGDDRPVEHQLRRARRAARGRRRGDVGGDAAQASCTVRRPT